MALLPGILPQAQNRVETRAAPGIVAVLRGDVTLISGMSPSPPCQQPPPFSEGRSWLSVLGTSSATTLLCLCFPCPAAKVLQHLRNSCKAQAVWKLLLLLEKRRLPSSG